MENKLYSNIACIKEVKVEIEVIKEGNKDVKDKIEEVKRWYGLIEAELMEIWLSINFLEH